MRKVAAVGFSGTRNPCPVAREAIEEVLWGLTDIKQAVTGGGAGTDALVGRWFAENRSEVENKVIVPGDWSRVDPWWLAYGYAVSTEEMPEGSTYKERNYRIAWQSDRLYAFPAYPEDDSRAARSGTWQTVRMARKMGKSVEVLVTSLLEGSGE